MAAEPETRIKVFISYSRADKAFASDLVLGLAACGFAPYIDRQDIAAGEDWEKRLAGLISEADSIVYVISPDSLTSENCAQEFQQALALQKRILPVVWRPVDDAAAPPEMKRLNYIFFAGEGRTFAAGLADLAAALRTDIDWIREHTRLSELARRWSARGRTGELLLRGDDIDAANSWLSGKPITAPAITDEQADFIKASSDARVDAERRAQRARKGLLTAVSVVAVAMTGLAALSVFFWQDSLGQRDKALTSESAALSANNELTAANLRLNARIGLQIAPLEKQLTVPEGWFQAAAQYSGAVAVVQRYRAPSSGEISSAFVIDGSLIHPRFAGEALLLTPESTENLRSGPEGADSSAQTAIVSGEARGETVSIMVYFPAAVIGDMERRASERVWRTPPEMGGIRPFELYRLNSGMPLPQGARSIGQADIDCTTLGMGGGDDPGARVPLALYGFAYKKNEKAKVTLFLSERLDRSDPYNIRYTHSTSQGAAGAMVFDLSTNKVTAIHTGTESDPGGGGLNGHGVSLRLVLDMIRSKMSDQDAQLGPVCGPE